MPGRVPPDLIPTDPRDGLISPEMLGEGNASEETVLTGARQWKHRDTLVGPQGEKGNAGPQGIPGPEGPRGARSEVAGPEGLRGPAGPNGERGEQGESSPALLGPMGDQGPKGDQGPRGHEGPTGDPGPKGERGFSGPRGLSGVNGTNGAKGSTGDRGSRGYVGPKGDKGDPGGGGGGEQGPPGPQGPQGVPGADGAAGAKGDTGDAGAQGNTGVPGGQGEQGIQGTPGDAGAPGGQGEQGIQGIQGNPGAKGDTGDVGAQGSPGIDGEDGAPGAKGDTGDAGAKGDQGDPGPNQVTTSTTTNIAGLLKGAGGVVAQAQAGSDFAAASHGHVESEVTNLVTDLSNKVVVAGQIGGTPASPDVRGIRESGGQLLTAGVIGDGQVLARSGAGLVGQGAPAAAAPEEAYYRHYGTTRYEAWHTSPKAGTALAGVALVAGRLYAMPFPVPRGITIDRIGVYVSTPSTGAARLGIYADAGGASLCYPGSLVIDAGTIDVTTTGAKSITISQALSQNSLYWLVILCQATPAIYCIPVAAVIGVLGHPSALGTGQNAVLYAAQTYGALPATFPTTPTLSVVAPFPAIFVRLSA